MKVYLDFLGCRLNEAELQNWSEAFVSKGLGISRTATDADLVVLNSCAVTGEAARKSRQMVRRYHRANPAARLVVTGCYASLEPEEARGLMGVDLVVANDDKEDLVEQAAALLELPAMPEMATEPAEPALFALNRERAFIKVQDGCRYRCTYCIVTIARGDERSRTESDIIDQINHHYSEGIREIVLTGVHVGGYGADLGSDLKSLVTRILSDTDMPRIRFASVEPWDLPDDFFSLFDNPRLMPHMHLPLQSGADSVLRRMARRCKTAQFSELVARARQQVPGFNVTTDIIVGFPGETDEEFARSLEFIEATGFGHIHIFSFSPRAGTKAARLPGQLTGDIKKARSQQLHALAARLKREALADQTGRVVDILWESGEHFDAGGKPLWYGHTPNYHRVQVAAEPGTSPARQILGTRITGLCGQDQILNGELLEQPVARADQRIPVVNFSR